MRVDDLLRWIKERQSIYEKKEAGEPKPWTKDKIFQRYRFCNVYREFDTVTQWININWRTPHYDEPDVWFAMVIARFVNWPETLSALEFPIPWNAGHFVDIMERRKLMGKKVFTGAYMIHADGKFNGSKARYLAEKVFTPMWKERKGIRPQEHEGLSDFYKRLRKCHDIGSFMAGQIIADTKFTRLLREAPDWYTWAVSGPGSKRGMNRLIDQDVSLPWPEPSWKMCLDELRYSILAKLQEQRLRIPTITAQDLQNCLCEFDKYERVRLGEGRPRSLYPGSN